MIYINISDTVIEAIQTAKSLIVKEKIIASVRKEIPEGIIVNGLVKRTQDFIQQLRDLFSQAYPKPMKDTVVSLSVENSLAVTRRLKIPKNDLKKDLSEDMISEFQKYLKADLSQFENLYKVVEDTPVSQSILLSAMKREYVAHFGHIFKLLGFKIGFISTSAFAIHALIKPLINPSEQILFVNVNSLESESFYVDKLGPVVAFGKQKRAKTLAADIKPLLSKIKAEGLETPSRLMVSGEKAIEVHVDEASTNIGISVGKLSDTIEEILDSAKVIFESGGIPKMFYDKPLGLLFLIKSKSPPDFSKDIKTIMETEKGSLVLSVPEISPDQVSENREEKSAEINTQMKDDNMTKVEENEINSDTEQNVLGISPQFIEHKKNSFGGFFKSKLFIGISAFVFLFIGISVVLFFNKGGLGMTSIFFGPTVTPTPSQIPTQTPTPTLDPSLKRSDLKVRVENGTGISGYAGEIADSLEKSGYENVVKANADKDDYQKSVIKIKEGKKNYLLLFFQDLPDKIDTTLSEDLDADSSFDVVIILGKDGN